MSGVDRPSGSPDRALREFAGLLREATGESRGWAERITRASRLEDDLQLESIEYAELCQLIAQRYGSELDVAGYLAQLDIDELLSLTVGDLLGLLGGSVPAGDLGPLR